MQTTRHKTTRETGDLCAWSQRTAAVLAVLLACVSTSRAQTEADAKPPPAEDIIARSIKAMGGEEAMEKLHSRVSKWEFEIVGQGVSGPMTVYEQAPNKQYTLLELEGLGKMESGTDGDVHWEINPMMGPRVLEGPEKALNVRQSTFNAQLYWKKMYKKAESAAIEDIDGRPCFKVVFTPEIGKPETTWYDSKSLLPVRIQLTMESAMGELPVIMTPSEYKKVDGILIPHQVEQVIGGGMQTTRVKMTSVEHNVEIPADRFDLPDAIKSLLNASKKETKPAKPAKP